MEKTLQLIIVAALSWVAALPFNRLHAQDLYDIDKIWTIKIEIDDKHWDKKMAIMKKSGKNERLKVNVVVNDSLYTGAGIRYKGNSSYFNVSKGGSSKLPFNIKLDFTDKKAELEGGVTTLKLSNVFRDPSFLREVLSYRIVGKYMPAPKANFAQVYVNDEYLGLYNCTESVDDVFLDKYFDEHKGGLIKCDPNWQGAAPSWCEEGDKASLQYLGEDSVCYYNLYEMKDDAIWKDLIHLTSVLNKQPNKIETVLDVDQVLWMHAFNNVMVNLDSYLGRLCHNYYLYRDKKGVYHPIPWDMNLSFGGFGFTGIGGAMSNEEMQKLSPFIHFKEKNEKRPLITNLLNQDLYRKIYLAHMKTMLDENINNNWYLEEAERIRNAIRPMVEADKNKLYSMEGFEENLTAPAKIDKSFIIGIEELMTSRAKYLNDHAVFSKPAPELSNVQHIIEADTVMIQATATEADQLWLFHKKSGKLNFSKQKMEQSDDDSSLWSLRLPLSEKGMDYYIVAENKFIASLSPARASYEFYKVEVQEKQLAP